MGILGTSKLKLFAGDEKVKKAYLGDTKIYSAGNIVTYYVDSSTYYQEEVDSEASCLNPTTFTPSKDGWTFVGWRADNWAAGDVLTNKTMEDEPITLYAVYSKTITANMYSGELGNGRVLDTPTGTAYYNASGDISNAQIPASTGKEIPGWTWRGWSKWYDGSADGDVYFNNGDVIPVHPDNDGITFFGLYQKTITETFVDYDGTSGVYIPVESTAFYNSSGNAKYSEITAPDGGAWADLDFMGWGYANSSDTSAEAGAGWTWISTEDCQRSAIYSRTVTLSYDGNGATDGSMSPQTGTQYCNILYANWYYPNVILAGNGFTKADYTFSGWDLGAAGASVTLSADTTAYAQWTRMASTPFYLDTTYLECAIIAEEYGEGEAYRPRPGYDYWLVICTHDEDSIAYSSVTDMIRGVEKNHCSMVSFTCFTCIEGAFIKIGSIKHNIVAGENVVDISSLTDQTLTLELETGYGATDHSVQISTPYFY